MLVVVSSEKAPCTTLSIDDVIYAQRSFSRAGSFRAEIDRWAYGASIVQETGGILNAGWNHRELFFFFVGTGELPRNRSSENADLCLQFKFHYLIHTQLRYISQNALINRHVEATHKIQPIPDIFMLLHFAERGWELYKIRSIWPIHHHLRCKRWVFSYPPASPRHTKNTERTFERWEAPKYGCFTAYLLLQYGP